MMDQPLRFGAAYHGNRMPRYAEKDMLDMATHGMEIVVHTFSHTDWERHHRVMGEIFDISREAGLDVWVDNWGLGGPPGDKSHFLAYYPESHVIMSDGSMDPVHACVNSPDFRAFTRSWIDAVYEAGGRTIFWDEPHLPQKEANGKTAYGCTCPRCRKLYEEKYGKPMPEEPDETTEAFGAECIADYFAEMTAYSHQKGMINTVCVMLGTYGMSLEAADRIAALPYMDNIGSDPYWVGRQSEDPSLNVYNFVRSESERNLELCKRFGKDHNLWIQLYDNPRGREEDVVLATEAVYDAGARNIIAWGYYGSSSNDYGAENPPVAWAKYCEAVERVRNMERDKILSDLRKNYKK